MLGMSFMSMNMFGNMLYEQFLQEHNVGTCFDNIFLWDTFPGACFKTAVLEHVMGHVSGNNFEGNILGTHYGPFFRNTF